MLSDDQIMAQVLAVFREEAAEHRGAISEILLDLERQGAHLAREQLDLLFRHAHSMKGGARASGLDDVECIAHRLEDLFSAVRSGQLALDAAMCDLIYAGLEAIAGLMESGATTPVPLAAHATLLEQLSALVGNGVPKAVSAAAIPASPSAERLVATNGDGGRPSGSAAPSAAAVNGNRHQPTPARLAEAGAETVRIDTAVIDQLLIETGELTTCTLRGRARARETHALLERAGGWRRLWRQARPAYRRLREREVSIQPTVHYLAGRDHFGLAEGMETLSGETRVLLDTLHQANDLISDLHRELDRHARLLAEDAARLTMVAERLQLQVRQTRMLPLAQLFSQLRLQTRDIARAAGKHAELTIQDDGAAADRQVIERVREVLTHVLRNAVDHGIEPPAVRQAAGKPAAGRLALTAAVNGDRLTLTLRDDGAGLNLAAIRAGAAAAGLAAEPELARMGESELTDMIFLPGFSTREVVSTLSGRGVGLDIVRSNVERMQGRVTVESWPGQGCAFTVVVPLSLATARGLLLQAGQLAYALPLDSILRIVAVSAAAVKVVEGRQVLALDNRPVPLVGLAQALGAAPPAGLAAGGLAVLLGASDRQCAYLVDGVLGEQELMVHRLPAPIHHVACVSGAAIMPDGCVLPVLDPVDLLRAGLGVQQVNLAAAPPAAPHRSPVVLVVDDSLTTRTLEKNILQSAGYQVHLATDGVEALARLAQLQESGGCDLVLSDIDMPRMNGFDLTAQMRADPDLRHLPIVLVTSLDTPADRERGIAAGADAYIVKQRFDQQTLLEKIAQFTC